METLKNFFYGIVAGLAAYLRPIEDSLFILLLIFTLNFVFGLIAGLRVNNESFSFKKAFRCVTESATIAVLIAAIYTIGEKSGDVQMCLTVTSYLVYVIVICYGQNIVKNINAIFPNNRFFFVLDYILSAEWLKISNKFKTEEVKDEI